MVDLTFTDKDLESSFPEGPRKASTLPDVLDPSIIGFPPMLVFEMAMNTGPIDELFEEYGLNVDDYERLKGDPIFINALRVAKEQLQEEGMSFKIKAKLQAEELLKESWSMIKDQRTPHNVRADLIKATMRWAGHESKAAEGANIGTALQINISLGDK